MCLMIEGGLVHCWSDTIVLLKLLSESSRIFEVPTGLCSLQIELLNILVPFLWSRLRVREEEKEKLF